MEWRYLHIYILYMVLMSSITGTIWTFLWMPVTKVLKQKGRVRTVYILLKFTMAGYMIPVVFIVYLFQHLIIDQEAGYLWIFSDVMYYILTCLFYVWFGGTTLFFVRYIHMRIETRQKYKARYFPTSDEIDCMEKVKKELGIRRNVRLFHGFRVASPFSVNYIRPTIYLAPREYEPKELHMVLTHELYHIKFHDIFWKPMYGLVRCIYWFLPYFKYTQKQYSRWTEANCDNHCCEDHFHVKDYIMLIVNTVMENQCSDNMFASNWCENEHDVVWRLQLIDESVENAWKSEISVMTIIAMIVMGVVGTGFVEYGLERLYSEMVSSTHEVILLDINGVNKIGNYQDAIDVPSVSWIEQTVKKERNVQFVEGKINEHVLSEQETGKSEPFVGNENDTVGFYVFTDSDTEPIEVGIINKNGECISVTGTGVIFDDLTIPETGEYSVFIRNTGTEKTEVHGKYATIPVEDEE